jgi:hypothetical protein
MRKIIALTNGRAIVAIDTATAGFRLNLKCMPFESGSTNINIYQIDENQSAANAGISEALTIVWSLFDCT